MVTALTRATYFSIYKSYSLMRLKHDKKFISMASSHIRISHFPSSEILNCQFAQKYERIEQKEIHSSNWAHMGVLLSGRLWSFYLVYKELDTVFPQIVSAGTILFWKWKKWKFEYSFPIMAIFYFINWIVAVEIIEVEV